MVDMSELPTNIAKEGFMSKEKVSIINIKICKGVGVGNIIKKLLIADNSAFFQIIGKLSIKTEIYLGIIIFQTNMKFQVGDSFSSQAVVQFSQKKVTV